MIVVGSQAGLDRVKSGLEALGVGASGGATTVWDREYTFTLWNLWPPVGRHPEFGEFSNNSRYVVFDRHGDLVDGGVWNCLGCGPPWTP